MVAKGEEVEALRGKVAEPPRKASGELEEVYVTLEAAAEAFLASSGTARYAAAKRLQTSVGAFYRFDKQRRAAGEAA